MRKCAEVEKHMQTSVLFLGGPGNISDSTIGYFLQKGVPVAAIKRTQGSLMGYEGKIRMYYGDRNQLEVLLHALRDFQPDILIDCTCFDLAQAATVACALRIAPVRRFLFISTADVYGYPLSRLPMGEADSWRTPNDDYAEKKKAIEAFYREALAGTTVGYTIIRPGYSLGKTFCMGAFGRDRGIHMIARIRQGLPVYSPGDGTTLIDAGAAYNTGRMIARICEDNGTIGEDYNCANNQAITYDEYLLSFGEALGKPVHIVHIPTDFMFSLGRREVAESPLGSLTQFHLYFSVEKFRRRFPDFCWEYSIADAVRDYAAYQESLGNFKAVDELRFEDRIIPLWQGAMKELKININEAI